MNELRRLRINNVDFNDLFSQEKDTKRFNGLLLENKLDRLS
jgi:hypothetical protein